MNKAVFWTAGALALAIASPTSAQATDWYMLDGGKGVCVSAAVSAAREHFPSGASPYLLQQAMRHAGLFKSLQITRNPAGNISIVQVNDTHGLSVFYFAAQSTCALIRNHLAAEGELGTAEELR